MSGRSTRCRRGILAGILLLLASLVAVFPVLPAHASAAAALRLLAHSKARYRQRVTPPCNQGPGKVVIPAPPSPLDSPISAL